MGMVGLQMLDLRVGAILDARRHKQLRMEHDLLVVHEWQWELTLVGLTQILDTTHEATWCGGTLHHWHVLLEFRHRSWCGSKLATNLHGRDELVVR